MHGSASPNGVALFPKQLKDGLLLLRNRSGSSLGDDIPDSWRLRYFGSVSSILAQAAFDADGDGLSNLSEFKAGTHPLDVNSRLRLAAKGGRGGPLGPAPFKLRWPSSSSASYTIEAAPALSTPSWTPLASGLVGTGQEMEFTPSNLDPNAQFFRVRLAE